MLQIVVRIGCSSSKELIGSVCIIKQLLLAQSVLCLLGLTAAHSSRVRADLQTFQQRLSSYSWQSYLWETRNFTTFWRTHTRRTRIGSYTSKTKMYITCSGILRFIRHKRSTEVGVATVWTFSVPRDVDGFFPILVCEKQTGDLLAFYVRVLSAKWLFTCYLFINKVNNYLMWMI